MGQDFFDIIVYVLNAFYSRTLNWMYAHCYNAYELNYINRKISKWDSDVAIRFVWNKLYKIVTLQSVS